MKYSLVVTCGLILSTAITAMTIAAAGRSAAPVSDDKAPLVESGYISKVDLKKKFLTVRGYVVVLPDDPPSPAGEKKFQGGGGGGRGGGGRGGGGRGGGARGAGGPSAEPIREFSVYVHPDTAIQDDKTNLMLDDLKIGDYVVVLGIPKGKSINVDASSISVSNR